MPPKRSLTLAETLDDINEWIDQNNDPDDDMLDDLEDLNGESDDDDLDNEEIVDSIDNYLSDTEEEAPILTPIQRHRKPLTRKRKVNSINAALEVGN